jgi:hypothetical protein
MIAYTYPIGRERLVPLPLAVSAGLLATGRVATAVSAGQPTVWHRTVAGLRCQISEPSLRPWAVKDRLFRRRNHANRFTYRQYRNTILTGMYKLPSAVSNWSISSEVRTRFRSFNFSTAVGGIVTKIREEDWPGIMFRTVFWCQQIWATASSFHHLGRPALIPPASVEPGLFGFCGLSYPRRRTHVMQREPSVSGRYVPTRSLTPAIQYTSVWSTRLFILSSVQTLASMSRRAGIGSSTTWTGSSLVRVTA